MGGLGSRALGVRTSGALATQRIEVRVPPMTANIIRHRRRTATLDPEEEILLDTLLIHTTGPQSAPTVSSKMSGLDGVDDLACVAASLGVKIRHQIVRYPCADGLRLGFAYRTMHSSSSATP